MKSYKLNRYFSFLVKDRIKNVGIVGCGQMGTGIALVCNKVGNLPVYIYDQQEKSISHSQKFTEQWCNKEISKQRLTKDEKDLILSRAHYTSNLDHLKECDFIIEAIAENQDTKSQVFKYLDSILPQHSIISSNTSSISITKLAAATQRPSQVIGMHFMNPVPVMKLVEVVKGLQTSSDTLNLTKEFAIHLQKEIVEVNDIPGFAINRVLIPYINEAVFALYEGVASKEDIDKAMRLGTNVPMGPLTLADFIGLDTDLADSKYRPCPLLVNYVNAGYLGKKSGRGFYIYDEKQK